MERSPGLIGTAGVPLMRQVNISCLAELIPNLHKNFKEIFARLGEGYYTFN
jgi:hypothetical protein